MKPSCPSNPLPDAPAIPGLATRALRLPEDLLAMAAIRAAIAPADGIDPRSVAESVPTVAELERSMVAYPGFDPLRDVLAFTIAGEMVGYAAAEWWTERDGTWLYLTMGRLVPQWRRRGIGMAMLYWAEAHCRELAATHPTQGKAFCGANASETEHDAMQLLLNEGYYVAFTVLEMELDDLSRVSAAALPAGFVTRPLQADELRALLDSMNECFSDHSFGYDERYEDWVKKQDDLSTWHVAWDQQTGGIAGQVQPLVRDGRGVVEEASVRAPYRRRGLGQALVTRGLAALRGRGVLSARLLTMQENPQQAWRVYESIGFRVVKRFLRCRKRLPTGDEQSDGHTQAKLASYRNFT